MAETDQEADTLTYHVTDMSIPRKVAVENDTKVFNILALPNGPATDPHADRGEISGILSGAKEEDFRFGRVEFKSWAWNHDAKEVRVDSMRWMR